MKLLSIIKDLLVTIRSVNLLIICLSLYLVRYAIIKPILGYLDTASSLTDQAYMLIVAATVFIAAAGYVINDYFDQGIDAVNKPSKNRIGTRIKGKTAVSLYIALSLAGLFAGWYSGYISGIRYPILVFLLSAGLLYFYSASYKKMFLAGNVVISFLAALTLFIGILFDKNALNAGPVMTLVLSYSIFAFNMTLIREIIKDCEDAEGDQAFGANTLPVALGMKTARLTSSALTLLTFLAIVYIQWVSLQWQNMISFVYTTLLIQVPLLALVIFTAKARTRDHDHRNSLLAKAIMVTGLFSMLIFQLSSS